MAKRLEKEKTYTIPGGLHNGTLPEPTQTHSPAIHISF